MKRINLEKVKMKVKQMFIEMKYKLEVYVFKSEVKDKRNYMNKI